MQKKALPLPPEYQILRTPMTETLKHTINTCTEAYVSSAAVLVVAACFFLLTHIYGVCVSPTTCVGTALRGDTGRNKFPCGYSDLRMPIRFYLNTNAYLPSTYKRYFSPQNKFNKHFN